MQRLKLGLLGLLGLSLVCMQGVVIDIAEIQAGAAQDLKIVYLNQNLHCQRQPDRGGFINRASYANWTEPGAGHFIVPVNTEVEAYIERSGRGRHLAFINRSNGDKIYMEVSERNVGMTINEYLALITAPEPISLKNFSDEDLKGIQSGKAYIGMSKDAVRIALGYPAPHRTASLESAQWVYWKDRFRNFSIMFSSDGKVASIR